MVMPCDKKKKDTMVGPFLQNGVSLINLKAHAQKAQSLPESPGGTRESGHSKRGPASALLPLLLPPFSREVTCMPKKSRDSTDKNCKIQMRRFANDQVRPKRIFAT